MSEKNYTFAYCLNDCVDSACYFKWREVLNCNMWGVCVYPTDEQVYNLIKVIEKLDKIRSIMDRKIIITSGLRPKIYNDLLKDSAENSPHLDGKAIDFLVDGIKSGAVRRVLENQLDFLGVRMEKADTVHVHIDIRDPGPAGRYFKP